MIVCIQTEDPIGGDLRLLDRKTPLFGMAIKEALENCATKRIRSVAKSDAVYDGAKDAKDAEGDMSKANKAKDSKAFDKAKKEN